MNTKEIIQQHKQGKIAYHVALDDLVHLGMIQEEAHLLLFPPMNEGNDWDIEPHHSIHDVMKIKVRSEEE
tara:strand:+ start:1208 stop:1417 length:210 start_codon:yes stop_codon:yes gene_type:complete